MGISAKLLLLICVFAGISLVMINTIFPQLLVAQSVSFVIGIAVFLVVQRIPFRIWQMLAPYIFLVVVGALLVTYILGKTSKGSTRWISLGISQVQPSQFAKPALALMFATYAYRKSKKSVARKSIELIVISSLPLTLVFFQPDLGTTLVLAGMVVLGLTIWGMPIRYFALLGLASIVLAVVAWLIVLKPYQKDRIYAMLNPTNNLSTSGYNALQSQIAVGSGKIFGRGLGSGVQSELRFLPERQTDFFFASLSEELGFIGDVVVLVAYAALFYVLDRCTNAIRSPEGKLYSIIILGMLCVQFAINVGMNMGLLPITGITLPLLSYGGSSIVAICLSLGLVVSAGKTTGSRPQVEIHSFL